MSEPAPLLIAPDPASGHEFSESHNLVFGDLSWKMSVVGFFCLLLSALYVGVLALLLSPLVREDITSPLLWPFLLLAGAGALAFVSGGSRMRSAASHFNAIVRTEGSDVARLLDALRALTGVFRLWGVALAVIAALLLTGLLVSLSGWSA